MKEKKKVSIKLKGFWAYFYIILMMIGTMTVTCLIVYFIAGGTIDGLQSAAWMAKYKDAYRSYPELRAEFADYVKQCEGDQSCVIEEVANVLVNRTDYIGNYAYITSMPQETLMIGGGDCEDLSVLTVSVLKQFNINAFVDCSVKYHHCVAFAFPDGEDYHYVVDLVNKPNYIQVLSNKLNFWSYYG